MGVKKVKEAYDWFYGDGSELTFFGHCVVCPIILPVFLFVVFIELMWKD